jgi:AraC-like DNA-binding protein
MNHRNFTPEDPALPMTYPGFVFRVLCNEGHAPSALLSETGLAAESFADPNFRCGFAPLRRFLLNAIEQSGDPHLGIRLAKKFQPTFIGLPAYAAMNAKRFRDALEVLNRFFFLAFPAVEFRFPDEGAELNAVEVAVRLHPKFPFTGIEYFASLSALVACEGLFRAILRMDDVVSRVETTTSEPAGWGFVADLLGFPVRFEAREDRVFFPARHLDRVLPADDPINHARLVALCEKFAREATSQATAVSQVTAFVEQERKLNAPLSAVAVALGYSERGLRRQLERSGTSYRKLVDEVRTQRARDMLATTALPIQTIAYMLGFETPSNFARSFKRWTGTTPKDFRDGRRPRPEAGQN